MRKIKFRAWDKKHKRMYEPKTIQEIAYSQPEKFIVDLEDLEFLSYTGLKDNDVSMNEIYEGDILRSDELDMNVDVFYDDGAFQILFDGDNESSRLTRQIIEANNLVKIGNIYENPELLEAK